ncbi:MAG: hypothetical protein ACK5NN_05905 [Sphingomonadaceae bacterium]
MSLAFRLRPELSVAAIAMAVFASGEVQAAEIDWSAAATAFAVGEEQAVTVFTKKAAARCAGRWMLHGDAVDDGAFPVDALYIFPDELRLPYALRAIDFFRIEPEDQRIWQRAADKAERQLRRVLAGDREAFGPYFEALGQCSAKAEPVSDYPSEAIDAPAENPDPRT